MIDSIPFKVPLEFAAGLADGSITRIGTLLKDTATGQIVAHVQETGVAQNLLQGISSTPFMALGGLDLASSGYANYQLAQLKTMVEGLQVLQYANLGVALAGIGVSVIGFSMINKRLKLIERQVAEMGARIEQHFSDLSQSMLRHHYYQVQTLFEMAGQALCLKNPDRELLAVASQLGNESGYFRGEVTYMLSKENFDPELFLSLTRSYTLCNAGRLECLMLARELPAAKKVAQDVGSHYRSLFDPLVPNRIAINMLPIEERWLESSSIKLKQIQGEVATLVQGVRDATEAALTKPYLIDTLIEKDIDGYEYIKTLREEKSNPLYLLAAT